MNSHYEHHLKITQMVIELNGDLMSVLTKRRLYTVYTHTHTQKIIYGGKKREVKKWNPFEMSE